MQSTVFYSWQSQLPTSINRNFILSALEKAAAELKSDAEITVDQPDEDAHREILIDHDTKGIVGAPRIDDTIRDKIDVADVVVCDLSVVQGRSRGRWSAISKWFGEPQKAERPTANQNVLVELGYALKSLETHERLVLVMNTAYGNHVDLPFDLRQHRPTEYALKEGASEPERIATKKKLVSALKKTIKAALDKPNRRNSMGLNRCGNVFWFSNNMVYTVFALSEGRIPDALREWNHAIHHGKQLPIPEAMISKLHSLQSRDLLNLQVRRTVIQEIQALWTQVGQYVQDHQPDFLDHDVQDDAASGSSSGTGLPAPLPTPTQWIVRYIHPGIGPTQAILPKSRAPNVRVGDRIRFGVSLSKGHFQVVFAEVIGEQ